MIRSFSRALISETNLPEVRIGAAGEEFREHGGPSVGEITVLASRGQREGIVRLAQELTRLRASSVSCRGVTGRGERARSWPVSIVCSTLRGGSGKGGPRMGCARHEAKEIRFSGVAAAALALAVVFVATVASQTPQASPLGDERLTQEMLAVYQSGREEGIRSWMKVNAVRVSPGFIVSVAKRGVRERSEALLGLAAAFAEATGDVKCQADVLFQAGTYSSLVSENQKAMGFLEKALALYGQLGDLSGQGNVYRVQGDVYLYSGDNGKALEMYQKAAPILDRAGDPLAQGNLSCAEGDLYLYSGDYTKALEMYGKALPFYEKAGDSRGQGKVYKRQGDIFLNTGQHAKALAMYGKALPYFEKTGEPLGQGGVYLGQAIICLHSGDNAKALANYERALPFYEEAKESLGMGSVYMGEGDIHVHTGEYAKAMVMYEKALPLFEKAQSPSNQGAALWGEAEVYQVTGEYAKALATYDKATPLFEKAQSPLDLGNLFRAKGDLCLTMGQPDTALAMYEKALSFFETAQSPLGQGDACRSEGELYRGKGESAKAMAVYEKALAFYESAHNPLGQGNVCRGEGDLHFKAGELAKALTMYEKALGFYDKLGEPEPRAAALFGKAHTLGKMARTADASRLIDEAVGLLERVRAQTAFSELKKSFMAKVYEEYDEAARFMLDNRLPEKAFRIAESMKARVFLDSLAEGLVRLDEGLLPELRERRDGLAGHLIALRNQVEVAAAESDSGKVKTLQDEISGVEAELEKVQVEIRLKNPKYAQVRYPQPISVRDLRRKILEPNEVLVEYFLSPEASYVFLITRESFKAIRLPADPKGLGEALNAYLAWLSSPGSLEPEFLRNSMPKVLKKGLALYEMLIKPLEASLTPGSTVVFVPDGELARLPFEALPVWVDPASGKPSYFIERHSVRYVQSASVLAILRSGYGQEGSSDAFIGFGDPVYDYEHFQAKEPETGSLRGGGGGPQAELNRSRYGRAGGVLERLPGTGDEVRGIAALFAAAGKNHTVNLRVDAREEDAKGQAMANYGYVHFACHGLLDSNFQSLVLSQFPDAKDDGYLTATELMACRFRARLVVLSACETGKGTMERGEGVTGLTRAVMYAGSPATVVSLWSVADEGTKELMLRFYRTLLQEHVSKGEVLRKAKLAMLQSDEFAQPFFWAAFVMYGE